MKDLDSEYIKDAIVFTSVTKSNLKRALLKNYRINSKSFIVLLLIIINILRKKS